MVLVILGKKLRRSHHASLVRACRILVVVHGRHELLVIHCHLLFLMCNVSVSVFGNWANWITARLCNVLGRLLGKNHWLIATTIDCVVYATVIVVLQIHLLLVMLAWLAIERAGLALHLIRATATPAWDRRSLVILLVVSIWGTSLPLIL